ncbi:unnamed protein product [Dibothriocephalus latus]|uniref:Uncharacterized protein n=1 Tax=Dibothriocephalus latus TaxID=60516 RepID=A0A3P7LI52_DIBLA|nr:unnamed protein product [Dibothriocephalus latus]
MPAQPQALTMLSDLAAGQAEKPNTPADPSSSPSELVKSEFSENPGVSFSEPTKAAAEARPEELRTTRRRLTLLGVFDGFVGCMFALTQYVAGVIIERTGYNIQLGIIISAGVLGLICVICLPETRPVPTEAVDESVDMASSSGNTKVSSPRNSLGCRTATFFRNPMFILGFLIAFLAAFVLWADVNVSMLYLMGKPFVWQSSQVGLFMGLRNASSAIVTTVIFLTMSLSANCCFSKPTEAQASEQVTPSGAEDETFTAFSRLPPRELSPTTKRYRRRLIAGIVTTLGLLTLSRIRLRELAISSPENGLAIEDASYIQYLVFRTL